MTKQEKLIERFLSVPADFSYSELGKLLRGLGFKAVRQGKTSGARVAFVNRQTEDIIRLHKPHPEAILKQYQLRLVKATLKEMGYIT